MPEIREDCRYERSAEAASHPPQRLNILNAICVSGEITINFIFLVCFDRHHEKSFYFPALKTLNMFGMAYKKHATSENIFV